MNRIGITIMKILQSQKLITFKKKYRVINKALKI